MRKLSLFSRLAAVLLTVMMTLSWQAFAEDINVSINLKRGEIYSGEWATRTFKGETQNTKPFLQSGSVDIFPTELPEQDVHGNRQFQIGNIYCPLTMSEGASVIKVQPAMDYDEWDNVSYNTYTITVNVSGTYVAAVPLGDNVESGYPNFYEPDPNALNNLTIPQGATRDNMVKLAYVWSTGYMGAQAPENFIREWHAVPAECVTLTSSNSSIVAISDGKFVAQSGTAGQSVTITMSCAPTVNNSEVPTGSVSFTLNVVEAGEKDNINLFLTKDYDRIYNGDGYTVDVDELGYYEIIGNTIRVMHDLGGGDEENFTGALRVVSSNSDIATASVIQQETYYGLETQIDVNYYPVFGTATISVIYDGDAQYADTTLTFTVTTEEVRYPAHRMELRNKNGNPLTELNVTEGDSLWDDEAFRFYDLDRASYYCYPFNRLREEATLCHHFYWPMHGETVVDSMYFFAPGEDTLRIRYRHYNDDPWNEFKVPVHIAPLVNPVSASASTSVNFASTDPTAPGSSVVFADSEYDKYKNGQLEINTAMTQAQVKDALDSIAFGSATWLNKLPGTVAFNLSQGSGKIDIYATVSAGYGLYVRLRSDRANTASLTPVPAENKFELTYNVVEPTAVIIYVAATGGSPAPKRALQAQLDEPKAIITSIGVAPNFAISAKQDPDDAGKYYATFFDSARKFALPNDGTKAFVAKIEGTDMTMTEIAKNDEIIPANTAVILQSPTGSFSLTPSDGSAVTFDPAANQLQGVDEDAVAPTNCYVLSGKSADNTVQGVGFYEYHGTLAAHKAYLIYSGSSAPKRMRFIFNNEQQATGIDNAAEALRSEKRIENGQLIIIKNGVRYNAQGQVVK